MKRMALGMLLASVFGAAQAAPLSPLQVDYDPDHTNFAITGYSDQPLAVTGAKTQGSWGSLFTTTAGTFYATYLGNESGFTNNFSFGLGSTLLESFTVGTTISQSVGAGLVDFSFSDRDYNGAIHVFSNVRDEQSSRFGFAIMDGSTRNRGTFAYILGFNDSWNGDADYDDFVVGVNFVAAPVPEPETYAMLLAGLGLLGMSVRRRKGGMFD